MSYSATNWVDGSTPVNATNLNKLEQAVSNDSDLLDGLTSAQLLWDGSSDNMVAIENGTTISVDLSGHTLVAIMIYNNATSGSAYRGCIIAPVVNINMPLFVQSGITETGYVRIQVSSSGVTFSGVPSITASAYAIYGL